LDQSAGPALHYYIDEDGSFLVIDGDIFNLDEIASDEVRDQRNPAKSLFELYRSRGEEVFAKLDGGASIALWDSRKGSFLGCRDHQGIVPSYYREHAGVLCWASNVPTLLSVFGYSGIDLPALDFFLGSGCCPAPWTMAKGFSKLPPAHFLRAGYRERSRIERYWRPSGQPKIGTDPQEAAGHLKDLLLKALRRRTPGGEDYGVMLSGGIDSRMLVAGLREIGRDFRAFTFRYEDYDGQFNEAGEASKTADQFGVELEEVPFRPDDIPANLDWMVKAYGEPIGHGLHTSMMSRIQAPGGMVLLNGAGTDVLYVVRWDRIALNYARLPIFMQRMGSAMIPLFDRIGELRRPGPLSPLYAKSARLAHGAKIIAWAAERGVTAELTGIWNPVFYRTGLYSDKTWIADAHRDRDALLADLLETYAEENKRDRIVIIDRELTTSEATLYWNHWWGRASGHRVRFPYLDQDVDAYVLRLNRWGKDKDDWRCVAERLLDKESANAPKIGQTVPIHDWFRKPLKDFVMDQLSPARVARSGIFDPEAVQRLTESHMRKDGQHAFRLWPIITTLRWQDLAASGKWD
jgi:asparagine synthase (glutamine-hydrolysing)